VVLRVFETFEAGQLRYYHGRLIGIDVKVGIIWDWTPEHHCPGRC